MSSIAIMPPKKVDLPKDAAPADWTEFRQALLAMHEDLQRTLQQSILELGETLVNRLPNHNPRLAERAADGEHNPFANCNRGDHENMDHRVHRFPLGENV